MRRIWRGREIDESLGFYIRSQNGAVLSGKGLGQCTWFRPKSLPIPTSIKFNNNNQRGPLSKHTQGKNLGPHIAFQLSDLAHGEA